MTELMNWELYGERRKKLRNRATYSEKLLWQFLKGNQAGAKFKRQSGIGPFIADFYCPEFNLVVELDGKYHESPEAQAYDARRNEYMLNLRLKVLRFKNEELDTDPDSVIRRITEALGQ